MQNTNKVSIITPSYNQGQFIEETLLSVKNQDYPNIEHIVIDGGSIDNTIGILRKYEGTYNLIWISEPDYGQTHAINKGLKMAKGEILAWLNSDDLYLTYTISTVVSSYKKYPEYDFFFGDGQIISPEGNILLTIKEPDFDYGILFYGGNPFGQPSTFFTKRMVERIGYLDETLNWSMDYEYWLRAAQSGIKFKQTPKVLSLFRVHYSSKSQKSHPLIMRQHLEVLNRYRRFRIHKLHNLDYIFIKSMKYLYRFKKVFLMAVQRGQFAPFAYKLKTRKYNNN